MNWKIFQNLLFVHSFCTARVATVHSTASGPACQGGRGGAVSNRGRRRDGTGEGNLEGNRRRRSQVRETPGETRDPWTGFLAEARKRRGDPERRATGVTFDAGPTRTWVRGRGSGPPGRRPLSRLGPLLAQATPVPQSWVRRFVLGQPGGRRGQYRTVGALNGCSGQIRA